MDYWISTDLASSSGVVVWAGGEPRWLIHVWDAKTKRKPRWRVHTWHLTKDPTDRWEEALEFQEEVGAWDYVRNLSPGDYAVFVTEAVYGPGADALAERRGIARTLMRCLDVPMLKVRAGQWREAAVRGLKQRWPAGRDAKKAFSVMLAECVLGLVLPDDVADAFWIGNWYLTRSKNEDPDRTKKRPRGTRKPDPRCRAVRARRSGVRRKVVRARSEQVHVKTGVDGGPERKVPPGDDAAPRKVGGSRRKRGRGHRP